MPGTMILDQLANAYLYLDLHPGLARGFQFLEESALESLDDGRHEIDGDRVFALLSHDEGKGQEQARIEHHRQYLDIQYVIDGEDRIGWMPTSRCQRRASDFEPDGDVAFYFDRPTSWLVVPEGSFAVFFPTDAHAPLGGSGEVFKAVVKVLLD